MLLYKQVSTTLIWHLATDFQKASFEKQGQFLIWSEKNHRQIQYDTRNIVDNHGRTTCSVFCMASLGVIYKLR